MKNIYRNGLKTSLVKSLSLSLSLPPPTTPSHNFYPWYLISIPCKPCSLVSEFYHQAVKNHTRRKRRSPFPTAFFKNYQLSQTKVIIVFVSYMCLSVNIQVLLTIILPKVAKSKRKLRFGNFRQFCDNSI